MSAYGNAYHFFELVVVRWRSSRGEDAKSGCSRSTAVRREKAPAMASMASSTHTHVHFPRFQSNTLPSTYEYSIYGRVIVLSSVRNTVVVHY